MPLIVANPLIPRKSLYKTAILENTTELFYLKTLK